MHQGLDLIAQKHIKKEAVSWTCEPYTQEIEAEESEAQGYP